MLLKNNVFLVTTYFLLLISLLNRILFYLKDTEPLYHSFIYSLLHYVTEHLIGINQRLKQ